MSVTIGFAEKPENKEYLQAQYFPTKIGGKPAWMIPKDILQRAELECAKCKGMLTFLMQDSPQAYHRTMYMFVCKKENCGGVKAFRAQLGRQNDFYDENIEEEEGARAPVAIQQRICKACGTSAPHVCGGCKIAYYCCREHQAEDWKIGHKQECPDLKLKTDEERTALLQTATDRVLYRGSCVANFGEFEVFVEAEPPEDKKQHRLVEDEMELVQQAVKKFNIEDESDPAEEGYESSEHKIWLRFQKRISRSPSQVIRYGGEPLWLSAKLPVEIPPCPCGAPRHYEFQILPQLLNYLHSDSLDWGTLAVYTCSVDCPRASYAEEYVFRQEIE